MRYLVVRARGETLCELRFAREGDSFDTPYECWAIRTGKQSVFVNTRMPNMLKTWYVHGTYETGAVYAMSVEEMELMLSDSLGENDRDRYLSALAVSGADRAFGEAIKRSMIVTVLVRTGELLLRVLWNVVKWFGKMLVVLFLIRWIGKRH